MVLSLYNTPGTWLSGEGPESDIVISSRIRLARNVAGFPFVSRMEKSTKKEFWEYLLDHISDVIDKYSLDWINLSPLSDIDRHLLLERHLVSSGIIASKGDRGILVNSEESIAIMVNEEDHLRIQCLASGFQLFKVWQEINRIDDMIGDDISYSFDSQFGFLTSCPTNIGTGLRVSVMMHLPGLTISDQLEKVFNAVSRLDLTVRGLYGEGTDSTGDFFQISNQVTLGVSEMELINRVAGVIPKVIDYERKARDILLQKKRNVIEDKIWRAFGILTYAHSVTSQEALTLLSLVRLGVNLGVIRDITIPEVNNLFIYSQPSHLQKRAEREMGPDERDSARADYLRSVLHN